MPFTMRTSPFKTSSCESLTRCTQRCIKRRKNSQKFQFSSFIDVFACNKSWWCVELLNLLNFYMTRNRELINETFLKGGKMCGLRVLSATNALRVVYSREHFGTVSKFYFLNFIWTAGLWRVQLLELRRVTLGRSGPSWSGPGRTPVGTPGCWSRIILSEPRRCRACSRPGTCSSRIACLLSLQSSASSRWTHPPWRSWIFCTSCCLTAETRLSPSWSVASGTPQHGTPSPYRSEGPGPVSVSERWSRVKIRFPGWHSFGHLCRLRCQQSSSTFRDLPCRSRGFWERCRYKSFHLKMQEEKPLNGG